MATTALTSSSTPSATSSTSTSSGTTSTTSTSGLLGSNGSLGNGTIIDVNAILTKLDAVEQAPIDTVQKKIDANSVAISDLGTLKSKMATLQTALQNLADPTSYLNESVTSSNTQVSSAIVSNSSQATAGSYALTVNTIASAFSASYGSAVASGRSSAGITDPTAVDGTKLAAVFGVASGSTIYIKSTNGSPLAVRLGTDATSLNGLRDFINSNTSTTNVQAAVVYTGSEYTLTLTSSTGGAANSVVVGTSFSGSGTSATVSGAIASSSYQNGSDASFSINGQSFTRPSNTINSAIPGVTLQLQSVGSSQVTLTSSSGDNAQTLVSAVGSAYNDLISSYQAVSQYNSDPSKRGSLYGDFTVSNTINTLMSSMSASFTKGGSVVNDSTGKPISLVSMGLELQLDGTLQFNSALFSNAMSTGVFDKMASGLTSPSRTLVDNTMVYGGTLDNDVTGLTSQNTYLTKEVSNMQQTKADKMARYQTQYAALDALLYQLQSTNNALTPTFTALNNPVKTG